MTFKTPTTRQVATLKVYTELWPFRTHTSSVETDIFCYIEFIEMDITAIIHDQNRWWENPSHRETLAFRYRRPVFGRIQKYLADGTRAAVLLGPRQVGKTTLLLQLADDLLTRGWPPGNLTLFDFSDERLTRPVSPRDVAAVKPVGFAPEHPHVLLFDEIQEAAAWPKWLKSAVDQSRRTEGSMRIVATGSAATALRDGTIESGQGRWDEIPIEGLSFGEALSLASRNGDESLRTVLAREPQAFERYLQVGGFPEHARAVSMRDARQRIRDDIAERAILRDLRSTGVDTERVRRLFVHLVNGSGNLWNQSDRAGDLEANRKSLGDWLSLLEQTRLVAKLEREPGTTGKARTQLRAQPKIFAADHGLITAFSPYPDPLDNSEVRGRVFEAMVFRHLREQAREGNGHLGFQRLDDDLEIDFVLRYSDRTIGIEVTSSTEPKPIKLRRTADVMRKAGVSRRLFIYGGLTESKGEDVDVVPIHEFLLAPEKYAGGKP